MNPSPPLRPISGEGPLLVPALPAWNLIQGVHSLMSSGPHPLCFSSTPSFWPLSPPGCCPASWARSLPSSNFPRNPSPSFLLPDGAQERAQSTSVHLEPPWSLPTHLSPLPAVGSASDSPRESWEAGVEDSALPPIQVSLCWLAFPSPGPHVPAAADATPPPSSTWLPKGGGVGVPMKSWMGAEPGQGFRVVTLICCRGRRGPGASPWLFGDAAVVARGSAAGVEPYL